MNPPWLAETTAKLRGARSADRLPTALLLHEAPGAGGELLAQFFAQLVLCREASDGRAPAAIAAAASASHVTSIRTSARCVRIPR